MSQADPGMALPHQTMHIGRVVAQYFGTLSKVLNFTDSGTALSHNLVKNQKSKLLSGSYTPYVALMGLRFGSCATVQETDIPSSRGSRGNSTRRPITARSYIFKTRHNRWIISVIVHDSK